MALYDGRVITGKVMSAPGGYLLQRPGSTDEMVPHFLVQTASDSLAGCYENLRDAIRHPRPDDHLKLADWCIRQRLMEEARIETVSALKLDPNRREARDLLVRIEEFTNPQPRNREVEAAPERSIDGFLEAGGRSTEGVSPETTAHYVRRIQPILVSKCANAACHGGSSAGDFQLANVRRNSSSGRTTTLENMREVLSYIDSGNVGSTRLMTSLESPAHAKVFIGDAGSLQTKALKEWVRSAAGDRGMKPAAEAIELAGGSPVWTREAIAQVSGEKVTRDSRMPTGPPATPQKVSKAPFLKGVPVDEAVVEKVLRDERPDPFDPHEFNRRLNGPAGKP